MAAAAVDAPPGAAGAPARDARLRMVAVAVILVSSASLITSVTICAASDRVGWLDAGWPWQAVTAACMVAGALITLSRPTHLVGWVLLNLGLFEPFADAVGAFRLLASGGAVSWWITAPDALATAEVTTVPLLLLLFPTGRLPSPHWRTGVALSGGAAVVGVTAALLNGGWGGDLGNGSTPSPIHGELPGLTNALSGLFFPLLTGAFITAGLSLMVRYRRSRGEERLQLQWLAAAAVLLLVTAPVYFLGGGDDAVPEALFLANLLLIPLAAGIAVVRYRLYEIDVVVHRTLVYGALTATLAAAYIGGVLLLQFILRPLTDSSDLAVAGSTLAVVALFRPARARIQAVVDRRFYRHRYDAARTLEVFGGRLREQLDLEALRIDLEDVVRETVAPTNVSLWLRPTGRP